jgi:hypothetical protein
VVTGLAAGASLPPFLLDDEEAVAVTVGYTRSPQLVDHLVERSPDELRPGHTALRPAASAAASNVEPDSVLMFAATGSGTGR